MPALPAAVRLRALTTALLLACAALLPACGDTAGPELEADTLFGFLTDAEELDRLESLVRQAEMGTLLQTGSDLTLFAPTDLALERLGPDMLYRIAGNPDVLLKILRRHLVPGRFRVADLRDGDTLTPLEGPPLTVRVVDDRVFVGEARLTLRRTDFETGNGLVHFLDDVVRDHLTLAERLRVTPLATDFAAAFAQAGLNELLGAGEPYTLLVPIDNAFDVFGGNRLQELFRFANRDVMLKVMRHHVLPGRVGLEDLDGTDVLTPLDGSPLAVTNEGGVRHLGGARVIAAEVEASDGLIYLIDRIVLTHLDLAEHIQIDPDLKTAYAILDRSGVLDRLREQDPHTAFLPADASLAPLGEGLLPALEARPELLLRTAQYAVVPGLVSREMLLQSPSLTTLGGHELPILIGSDVTGPIVFVGGRGRVAFPPLETRNGLLYQIAPFVYPPGLDLEGQAVFTALYRYLSLMEQAGLSPLLRGEAQYTIFAPTNAALEGVSLPGGQLPDILRAHIVEGRYEAEDIGSELTLTSLAGSPITIASVPGPGGGLFANGVRIAAHADQARNGVIYALEGLLP